MVTIELNDKSADDVKRTDKVYGNDWCPIANTYCTPGKECNFEHNRIHEELAYDIGYYHGKLDERRWIPVIEKLPKPGVDVLCWYEYFRYGNYNRMYQTYGIGYYFRDGMWGGEVSNGHKAMVLAWMELPPPPKGEQQ